MAGIAASWLRSQLAAIPAMSYIYKKYVLAVAT